jgi:hypothetical protein
LKNAVRTFILHFGERMLTKSLAVLLLASAASLGAATIFDNTSFASGLDDYATSNNHNGPLAASFTNGAGSFLFNDLKVSLLAVVPSDGGFVTVTLDGDSATSPGAVLDTLGTVQDSSLTSSNSLVDFSSFGITLAADTRYWIGISDSLGTSSIRWQYATGNGGVGAANEFYYYGGNVFPDTLGGYLMAISGSEAPEPATAGIAFLALGILATATKVVSRYKPQPILGHS